MKTDSGETKQEKLQKIITNKILPCLEEINGQIPNGFQDDLTRCSRIVLATKEQYVVESGPAEEGQLLFFDSGIARSYYYDLSREKYITTQISTKNDVRIDMNGFLHGHNRKENIQMLESGVLLAITYSNLKYLLTAYPEMAPISLNLQAKREEQCQYYQHLLKLSVDDRVAVYLEDNPGITTRINNDYIAQYLDTCRTRFSKAYAKYRLEKNPISQLR